MSNTPSPTLRPAVRVRLADQVVTTLLDAILDGRLQAGSLLPPERELADELDVNRTSLRQAIARLEQMGLVEARQGRGTVVRDVASATDPMLMAHLVARDRRSMLTELFEVREALAGLVGDLAARRATADERRTLRTALRDVAEAADAADRQRRELALFRHLVDATDNRPLVAMQEWVDHAYGDAAPLFVGAFDDGDVVVRDLTPLVDAVEAGDPSRAERAARRYATRSAERLLAAAEHRPRRAGSTR